MLIIFSKQFTHKDVFFIPGMFLRCKRNQRNVRNWKVTDRNWPCVAPIGFQIFGTPVSPVGGDLAVIGGLEHPRICSIPKYRPGFPPMDGKPPHRPFVISLKTTVLARTVPLTMHLRCIFYRNHSQLHWRPCIYSPYWMTLLNVFCWKQDIACTVTEWGRKKGWFSALCVTGGVVGLRWCGFRPQTTAHCLSRLNAFLPLLPNVYALAFQRWLNRLGVK